jgi:penicillin-binding protein 1C
VKRPFRYAVARRVLWSAACIAIAIAALFGAVRLASVPRALDDPPVTSVVLLDRQGGRIAVHRNAEERLLERTRLSAIDPLLVRATLAAEDHRFERHPGIDPLALARACGRALAGGRALGGASTLTMQVVRCSQGPPRGIRGRIAEVWWALVLEAHRSKSEILERYFDEAPYRSGISGVVAASRSLFAKPPSALSPAEAALLAALPRAPTRLDPARHPAAARSARNEVLRRMERLGWLSAAEARRAAESSIDLAPASARRAPHFADWILASMKEGGGRAARVTTTLDPKIQTEAERAVRERVAQLRARDVRGGAAIVLDTRSAEILALVGSPDYASPEAGQFNAALAPRQPGSAVKPFTYAVAFARDLRPSTMLADIPVSYEGPDGTFAPRNYAGTFSGPVSARLALANSWNVPAVEALRRADPAAVARGFEAVGLACADLDRLGLGLTLGAGEVSLLDLAAAYATLARGGTWIAPRALLGALDAEGDALGLPPSERRPALDPTACAWVNEILSDPAARAAAFDRGGVLEMPGAVAAKTGTSSDWRDAWTILYTSEHVVAVWMGNPDARPTDRVTGAEGPAVAARAILEAIEAGRPAPPFACPEGIERRALCPLSGRAAGPHCPQTDFEPFRSTDPPLAACDAHVALTIDVATGLLARPCTPVARRRSVVFARLPARYATWQADRGLPVPPTTGTPCICGLADCTPLDRPLAPRRETDRFAIVRPVDGTVIALDPTLAAAQQELALEAVAPTGASVVWKIDGKTRGTTTGPHRIFWAPSAGRHRIEATTSQGRAESSCIVTVLAGEPSAESIR